MYRQRMMNDAESLHCRMSVGWQSVYREREWWMMLNRCIVACLSVDSRCIERENDEWCWIAALSHVCQLTVGVQRENDEWCWITALSHVCFMVVAFFQVLFPCLLQSISCTFFIGVHDFLAHVLEFIWIRYTFTVTCHIVFICLHSSRLTWQSVSFWVNVKYTCVVSYIHF